jgi:hypothetical protein
MFRVPTERVDSLNRVSQASIFDVEAVERGGTKGRYWSNAKTEVRCDLERSRVDVKLRQKLKVGRRWPKSLVQEGLGERSRHGKQCWSQKSRAESCDRGLRR